MPYGVPPQYGLSQQDQTIMENIAMVCRGLGGVKVIGSPRSDLEFVPIVRAGFPVEAFTAVSKWIELGDETLYKTLRVAKRTGARRKANATRLKSRESELLLRLARVFAMAIDILGNKSKARRWLLSENRSLGGQPPIEMLDTDIGFQHAVDSLKRVEFGVYS